LSESSRLPRTTARAAPENLAILLREPLRAMNEDLIARLAAQGHAEVRLPHGNVFQYLDDDGTRVGVLAERAHLTKQAMAQLVAHLETHGYVERVPDPADGRAKLVRATARGREVYAIVRVFVAELDAHLERALGARKLRELRALLEELGASLSR
jgi:DNA-binding MarR family transcriptional regulator